MQKKVRKIIFLILILVLIIVLFQILFLKDVSLDYEINDYTFFKFFSNKISANAESKDVNNYEFKVKYNNIDFKLINILNTVDKEKSMYKKIAPGTKGSFDIVLNSNKNLKYKIIFKSINEKPENLRFVAYIDEKNVANTDNLEDLSNYLYGYILKDEKISVKIEWYWNYENENNIEESDIKDTEDARKIEKYQFEIYTYGEQIS